MSDSFQYTFKAHQTRYNGVLFRSRLEARWAAFFDQIGWNWEYEPYDIEGWVPDFFVEFPCGHSECNGRHRLLVEIKPFRSIKEFEGHPCLDYPYGFFRGDPSQKRIPADASAAFGINPGVTYWEMGHGAGGGEETIERWIAESRKEHSSRPFAKNFFLQTCWNAAGETVQWKATSPDLHPVKY